MTTESLTNDETLFADSSTVQLGRRSVLRFSLQAMLLAVAAKCIGLGWYVRRVEQQKQIVEWLKRNHGNATYETNEDVLESVVSGERRPWLADLLGDDFVRPVRFVTAGGQVDEPPPAGWPESLTGLREIWLSSEFPGGVSAWRRLNQLTEIDTFVSIDVPLTDAEMATVYRFPQLAYFSLKGSAVTGAGIECFAATDRLWCLEFENSPVDDSFPLKLAALSNLLHLSLMGTSITDAGLAALPSLPKLHTLYVSRCDVGDGGLAAVAKSNPQLQRLGLSKTKVTTDGLRQLAESLPLEFLNVGGMGFDDENIAAVVGGSPKLSELYLDDTQVRGEFAAMLRTPHSSMTLLHLCRLPIKDEHVPAIAKAFPNLFLLHLGDTQITDQGLFAFKGWSRDILIFVNGTHVTQAGADAIHAADPNVTVKVPFGKQFAN